MRIVSVACLLLCFMTTCIDEPLTAQSVPVGQPYARAGASEIVESATRAARRLAAQPSSAPQQRGRRKELLIGGAIGVPLGAWFWHIADKEETETERKLSKGFAVFFWGFSAAAFIAASTSPGPGLPGPQRRIAVVPRRGGAEVVHSIVF